MAPAEANQRKISTRLLFQTISRGAVFIRMLESSETTGVPSLIFNEGEMEEINPECITGVGKV